MSTVTVSRPSIRHSIRGDKMFARRIRRLSPSLLGPILCAGRIADEERVGVYLVGGFVRDLILGRRNLDIDIVVEGDGIVFARRLAVALRGKVLVAHHRFGTATIEGASGSKVDVASARRESYACAGALPTVERGSIEEDLWRRDFSINAMAVWLNRGRFGALVDPCQGRPDLEKGLIRALHAQSFEDDPLRILRAVRFEQRLGFRIEKETLQWILTAGRGRLLARVHKHRLRDELMLLLKEEMVFPCLKRLSALVGLGYVGPRMRSCPAWKARFAAAQKSLDWARRHAPSAASADMVVMRLALFFEPLSLSGVRQAMRTFAFGKPQRVPVVSFKQEAAGAQARLEKKDLAASGVYRILSSLSVEVVLLIHGRCRSARVRRRIEGYLRDAGRRWEHLGGEDLRRLGVAPGPRYKEALGRLRDACIDKRVVGREEELEFVRAYLRLR